MLVAINPLLISGERLIADQLLVRCSTDVGQVCGALAFLCHVSDPCPELKHTVCDLLVAVQLGADL